MDYDKLIERLNNRASRPRLKVPGEAFTSTGVYTKDTLDKEAADALEQLQAENEKLRAELEQVKRERDAAVKCIEEIEDALNFQRMSAIRLRISEWRGQKED